MSRFAIAVLAFAAVIPAAAQAPADPDRAVRQRLEDVRVDLDAQDADFQKAIDKLRAATGLNFVIDSQAQDALADDTPLGLRLSKIRAVNALRWLVRTRNLAFTIRDGVVLVTTPEIAAGRTSLRLFDVADILSQPRDFPLAGAAEEREVTIEDLQNLVQETIAPGTWGSSPRTLSAAGTSLVAQAEPEILTEVENLLAAIRVLAHFTVSFDARVLDLPANAIPGVPGLATIAPGKAILTAEEAAAVLARAGVDARVLQSAHFTCMNGQRTHVRLDREESSVQGALSADDAAAGLSKTVSAIRPTTIEVNPILVVGRDRFLVNLDAVLADPAIAPAGLMLKQGVVECARSSSRTLRTSFQVANGGAALFVPTAVRPATAEDVTAAKDYAKLLATKWNFDFADNPVSDVLNYVREVGAMNILVDPVLEREETISELRVALKLKEVDLKTALTFLAGMWDLEFTLRDDAIVFTRRGQGEALRVEIYDVRDLVWSRTSWTGYPLDTEKQWEALATEGAWGEAMAPLEESSLVDLIRSTVSPETWDNNGTMSSFTGALLVRQTPEVHKAMAAFLKYLRESTPLQIQADARVIEIDAAVHDALDSGADGPLPDKSRAALERAIGDGHARVDAAWSLLGMNAQRFHAFQLSTRAYVADYEKEAAYPDPVYGSLVGGHLFEIRPTIVSSDPGRLVVELRAACRDLPDQLDSKNLGRAVIQLPAWSRASLTTTVSVKSGETRMFSLGNVRGEGVERRRVLVWTVKVVE
ncbi:MAG: hypothetical protein FD180_5067 [Planctomycetota bacterium]|nr:MAG: hypothetical protein FD180_5067 [Planctomycetota bacterium]